MEEIIRDMLHAANIPQAKFKLNIDKVLLVEFAKRIINELANTHNAPSNWRDIGSKLASEWNEGTWEYDDSIDTSSIFSILALGDYGADEFRHRYF